MSTGYFHPEYANCVSKSPQTVALKKAKGFLLKRHIPHFSNIDLINSYPLMCCHNWSSIIDDIKAIQESLQQVTAVTIITDPFADIDKKFGTFFDTYSLFKTHFIVNLSNASYGNKHHRYETRRSIKKGVHVHHCDRPLTYLNDWQKLYENLIEKHQINGDLQFSASLFRKQFSLPGLQVFRACINNKTIGMMMWYISQDKAYYHLAANAAEGYKTGCAYALMDFSLHFLKNSGVKKVTLGAGPGLKNLKQNGLSRFKSGWANDTEPVYLAGKITNPQAYNHIIVNSHNHPDFFPAYRYYHD